MRRLHYLASARRDFAVIARWYVELGETEQASEKMLAALDAHCQRMAANPAELGRDRKDDLGLPVRSFAFKRYLILFRYGPGVLEVVRVVHGARDLETLLKNKGD
jgi:toxin ParE1/3/4